VDPTTGLDLKVIVDIAQFIITGAIAIYIYTEKKRDKNTSKIEALEVKVSEQLQTVGVQFKSLGEDLSRMDERLKLAVGHDDLSLLHVRINSMDKQLGNIDGKMHTLDLIHEFLMKGGGRQ